MGKQSLRFCFACLITTFGCGTMTRGAEPATKTLSEGYADAAKRIIDATLESNDAWKKMEELCDGIGNRLSGSASLEKAVGWAVESLKADGQDNVHAEKVMVPRWVRGEESLVMSKPRRHPIAMMGLGGSIGTPPEGITASVVVVRV